MEGKQYVVLSGNPVEGFTVHGPYASESEATDHLAWEYPDWWVAPLEKPDDGNDQEVIPNEP